MKPLRMVAVFVAAALAGTAAAQTATRSSAAGAITVVAAKTAAAVTLTLPAASVAAGTSATLRVAVAGAAGAAAPTGSVELLAQAPGDTGYTLINTLVLTAGSASCSYSVPASAALGTYRLQAVYLGDAKYF